MKYWSILAITLLSGIGQLSTTPLPVAKLSGILQNEFRRTSHADILVSFLSSSTSSPLQHLRSQQFGTRTERLNAVASALWQHAAITQQGILQKLKLWSPQVKILWVSNQILVKGADLQLVHLLESQSEVSSIDLDEHILLDQPTDAHPGAPLASGSFAWGIENIKAPDAWALQNGTAGSGIVIGSVDTGVRWTHEALYDNYVGDHIHGWYDPYTGSTEPNDQHGHGTHTLGSIVGKGGIGVAHDSKWMACKGCSSASCAMSALLECGQFMLCPGEEMAAGVVPDCSHVPHIVSNSWGTIRGSLFYNPVIEAYHLGEIIPVFSIGNSGPDCHTTLAPADQHTIGVGATTSADQLASFSSVGPSYYGDVKPNLVAPGASVLSAHHTADDAYYVMSGTSMAAPHIAGAVALLKAADPGLTFDYVLLYLYRGADTSTFTPTGRTCGHVGDDEVPNNFWGYGKVNAFNSLRELLRDQRTR